MRYGLEMALSYLIFDVQKIKSGMYTSKALLRKYMVKIFCTVAEKRFIEIRARDAQLPVSVFLRELGMKDSPGKRKTLPAEVMEFNGQLSGIIGSLEIIAYRRLDNEDLDSLQRAELNFRAKELKLLIERIKYYLQ